jgi:hypothetical protein
MLYFAQGYFGLKTYPKEKESNDQVSTYPKTDGKVK